MIAPASSTRPVLPQFCSLRLIAVSMIAAEIPVLILTVARPVDSSWAAFGLATLYVQWIALMAVALLCVLRSLLNRLPGRWPWLGAWLLALGLGLAVALAAWQLQAGMTTATADQFAASTTLIVAIIAAALLRYLYVRQQWEGELKAQTEARVQALQARIQPHFLFNSLNTIAGLVHEDNDAAETATLNLAEVLRGSLRRVDQLVPMSEELRLAHLYLQMERARLGRRLRLEWHIDGLPDDAMTPSLLLQPLLENAVRYGIEPRVDGGTVCLTGVRDHRDVVIIIENPVPEAAEQNSSRRQPSSGHGIALQNIRERLLYRYGEKARFSATLDDHCFRVEMRFPYEQES